MMITTILFCSFFSQIVTQKTIKIGVIGSEGYVNSNFLKNTVSRRVNSNWRVLPGYTLEYILMSIPKTKELLAVQNVCKQHPNVAGLISVGNCDLVRQVDLFSKSMEIPHIAIPATFCNTNYTDFTVQGQVSWKDAADTAVAVAQNNFAKKVAVYYDSYQDEDVLLYIHKKLCSKSQTISAAFYKVDDDKGNFIVNFTGQIKEKIKRKVHNMIILASPENTVKILTEGKKASVLQQNYFWTIMDTGIKTGDLLAVVPAELDKVSGDSNLLLVRGDGYGIFNSPSCPPAVLDIFPCNVNIIRSVDIRLADAVEIFSIVFNKIITTDGSWATSSINCTTPTKSTTGINILREMKKFRNVNSFRGSFSYSSQSNTLTSSGVIVTATQTEINRYPLTQFVYVAKYSPWGLIKSSNMDNIYPNKFTGWRNRTIQLCSPEITPFVVYHPTEKYPNGKRKYTGMLVDVLGYLSKKMQFRYEVNEARDKGWGGPMWKGAKFFTGCVGELQNHTMDFAASTFTNTAIRDTVIEFTVPMFEEANAVLVPRPKPASKMWNVFKPFAWRLWGCVIASMGVAAICTYILAKFSPLSAWNLKLPWAIADEVWLQEHIWSIMGSFLQQGQDFYPYAMSSRVVLAFWWLFTVVVFGTYTGDLTAHLTVTITILPIKSLDDLASQSTIRPIIPASTNLETLLAYAEDPTYKKLHEMSVPSKTIAECTARALESSSLGCATDYTVLLYMARKYCDKVYLVPQLFNTAPVSFMTPEDAYFKDLLDFYITKLHESGSMDRWFNKYWSTDKDCSAGAQAEADPIPMEGVGGTFILTCAFYCLGFIILFLELIWTKACGNKPLDCCFY